MTLIVPSLLVVFRRQRNIAQFLGQKNVLPLENVSNWTSSYIHISTYNSYIHKCWVFAAISWACLSLPELGPIAFVYILIALGLWKYMSILTNSILFCRFFYSINFCGIALLNTRTYTQFAHIARHIP